MLDFVFDIGQEVPRCRIKSAGEHEILPDEQTFGIAQFVERISLVLSAAPDSDHVHVGLRSAGEQIINVLIGLFFRHCIAGNPVSALAENIDIIDAENQRSADLVLFADEVEFSQTDFFA